METYWKERKDREKEQEMGEVKGGLYLKSLERERGSLHQHGAGKKRKNVIQPTMLGFPS